jgi:hypothetical protein
MDVAQSQKAKKMARGKGVRPLPPRDAKGRFCKRQPPLDPMLVRSLGRRVIEVPLRPPANILEELRGFRPVVTSGPLIEGGEV